ncbi:MAG: hypothetical protein ACREQE_03780, partial [Candidatus Binataceae bacterium]
AQLRAWLALFLKTLPSLYVPFVETRPMLGTVFEEKAIQALYASIAMTNFSSEVLQAYPSDLAVLPVRGVDWNDLGEPARVLATLEQIGFRPEWLRTGQSAQPENQAHHGGRREGYFGLTSHLGRK